MRGIFCGERWHWLGESLGVCLIRVVEKQYEGRESSSRECQFHDDEQQEVDDDDDSKDQLFLFAVWVSMLSLCEKKEGILYLVFRKQGSCHSEIVVLLVTFDISVLLACTEESKGYIPMREFWCMAAGRVGVCAPR